MIVAVLSSNHAHKMFKNNTFPYIKKKIFILISIFILFSKGMYCQAFIWNRPVFRVMIFLFHGHHFFMAMMLEIIKLLID